MEYTDATDFCMEFHGAIVFARVQMKDTREAPLTFRLTPELETPFATALETLGWTRTKLVTEALTIALPIILERQAARFQSPQKVVIDPVKAAADGAARVAKRAKSS